MGRGQTPHRHTYGHRDSMIESAQWADSMKMRLNCLEMLRNPIGGDGF